MTPQNEVELGTGENRFFYKPQSIDLEINWVIQGLRKHKRILQLFVSLREEVENNILLGNYIAAESLLDNSLRTIGYTVWHYEMKLTIAGIQDNLSKGINIISGFNSKHQNLKRGFVPIVLSKLFSRSQRSVAPYEYDSELYSRYKKNRTEFQTDRYSYFLFRLNYYQNYDIEDLSVTLIMESLNSVIDRYILMSYVLRSYLIKNYDKKEIVSHFASNLYRII